MKKSELRKLIKQTIKEQLRSRGRGSNVDPVALLKQMIPSGAGSPGSRSKTFIPKGDGPVGGGPQPNLQTQHDINPACNNEEDIALVNEFFTSYDAPWPNYLGHDLNYGSYCEGICSPAWSENTYHNQNEHSFISNDPNPPNVFADSVPPSSAFWWLIDWFRSACHCCPEGSIPTLGNHPNHMTGVMVGQNERPGVPLTPIGPQSHGDALQEAKRILKKIIGKRK